MLGHRLLRMPPRGVYTEILGNEKDISRMVPNDKTSVELLRRYFVRLSISDLFCVVT